MQMQPPIYLSRRLAGGLHIYFTSPQEHQKLIVITLSRYSLLFSSLYSLCRLFYPEIPPQSPPLRGCYFESLHRLHGYSTQLPPCRYTGIATQRTNNSKLSSTSTSRLPPPVACVSSPCRSCLPSVLRLPSSAFRPLRGRNPFHHDLVIQPCTPPRQQHGVDLALEGKRWPGHLSTLRTRPLATDSPNS